MPAAPAAKRHADADLADAIADATAALQAKRAAAPAAAAAAEPPAASVSYERRNDADAVNSARERYLARKRQKTES